jgi:integrase
MAKSHLTLVAPTTVNRTVAPTRRSNAELRTREHLTPGEVEALVEAAKTNRHGHRDATMILLAFRHGFRVAELCDLRWDQVEFNVAVLHVRRVKNGIPSTHPLLGDEMRALRRLQRESAPSPFVFVSEPAPPSRPPALPGWSSVPPPVPALNSRRTPTCCATPAATRSPTRATTPGRSRDGSAIDRSRALPSTQPWRQIGSRISGGTDGQLLGRADANLWAVS